jgi:hypothetical protein
MPCRGTAAPDGLWRYEGPPRHVLTWEAKIQVDRSSISVKDVNQAHGHGRWATEQFADEGFAVLPIILADMDQIDTGAQQRLGNVRCLTVDVLRRLAERVVGLFGRYRSAWLPNDPRARKRARGIVQNCIPDAGWLKAIAEAATPNGFLPEEGVVGSWAPDD